MASLWRSVVQNVRRILVTPPPAVPLEQSASTGRDRLKWMIAEQRKELEKEKVTQTKLTPQENIVKTEEKPLHKEEITKVEETKMDKVEETIFPKQTKEILEKAGIRIEENRDSIEIVTPDTIVPQNIKNESEEKIIEEVKEEPKKETETPKETEIPKEIVKETVKETEIPKEIVKETVKEVEVEEPIKHKETRSDLKRIFGLGPTYEKILLQNNITTTHQLSALTDKECDELKGAIKIIVSLRNRAKTYTESRNKE